MFAFHETTRKRVCRTAFFVMCVAPTLATAAWIGGQRLPGHQSRTARQLSDALAVHVKLANWRRPRPRFVRSAGLSLTDASSGHSLAVINGFEHQPAESGSIFSAREITVDAGSLVGLTQKIDAWLSKLPPETHEIRIGKLIVKVTSQDSFVVLHVQGRVDRDPAGRPRLRLAGHVDENLGPNTPAIQMTLEPSLDSASAARRLMLEIPCATPAKLLASVVPVVGDCGNEAAFSGAVQWLLDQPVSRGSIQGRLENVDLAAVLPAGSPHSMRGAATVELQEFSWRGTRIERLTGAIHAEDAQASRSLVDAAVKHFACAQASDGTTMADDASMVAIDLAGIRFHLDENGLTFWGNCPSDSTSPKGCMAISGLQPLLIEPRYYNFHPGVLVQAFAAPAATWLPASREALEMADRLPLPRELDGVKQ